MNLSFSDYDFLIGADEAGRGCFAGPICAAAVSVKPENIENIKNAADSKSIDHNRRRNLIKEYLKHIHSFSVVSVPPSMIDRHGLQKSNISALQEAILKVYESLAPYRYSRILVVTDHYDVKLHLRNADFINPVKADSKFKFVSMASILAKFQRDLLLAAAEEIYPEYSFSRHKGYGTAEHMKEIENCGISDFHRVTFKPLSQPRLFNEEF